jgi:GNAT superfamily N-acetyltransferase
MPIQIIKATVADISVIRNIAMATWPVTYSTILSVAQIEYMLGNFYKPSELQQQIQTGAQQYFIALQNSIPIGFASFGPQPEESIYKLQKLYVLPTIQKSGAGKALLSEVIRQCKEAGANRLILNVHRSNPARNYYERNGFRIYETKDIPMGPGFVLNDFLMEKEL